MFKVQFLKTPLFRDLTFTTQKLLSFCACVVGFFFCRHTLQQGTMSSSSNTSIKYLLFGGVFALSSLAAWYFYWRYSSKPTLSIANGTTQKPKSKAAAAAAEEESEEEDEEEEEEEEDDEEEDDEEDAEQQTPVQTKKSTSTTSATPAATSTSMEKPATVSTSSSVKVEDVESDDEDAAAKAKEEEALLRQQYDDAIRIAKKLLAGNEYRRAAEKFKEAIKLAEKVPSAAKDLVTLYNNSSAMYEKAGNYPEALLDINVVLHMDPLHVKARTRRGRVFEAQGKVLDALNDYVLVMMIEQNKGNDATAYGPMVDVVAKAVAAKETTKHLKKMRKNELAVVEPSKAFVKQFFESFPAWYRWLVEYATVDREQLVNAINAFTTTTTTRTETTEADATATTTTENKETSPSKLVQHLQAVLSLAAYDLHHQRFNRTSTLLDETKPLVQQVEQAFQLNNATTTTTTTSEEVTPELLAQAKSLLSVYYELLASFAQLSGQLGLAESLLSQSLLLLPTNVDAHLKQIILLVEFGELEAAEKQYNDWLAELTPAAATTTETEATTETPSETTETTATTEVNSSSNSNELLVTRLWVLAHRANLWTARNTETGNYNNNKTDINASSNTTTTTVSTTTESSSSNNKGTVIERAIKDIDAIIATAESALTKTTTATATELLSAVHRQQLNGVKYVSYHRAQFIINHTSGQMGLVVTDEQREYVSLCSAAANDLFPATTDTTRSLQHIESLVNDNNIEEALRLLDEGIARYSPTTTATTTTDVDATTATTTATTKTDVSVACSYLLMKANLLMQQGFSFLQMMQQLQQPEQQQQAVMLYKQAMEEAVSLHEKAIAVDVTSTEARSSLAQLHCLTGGFEQALPLIDEALALVRTREETQDLFQLLVMAKAQSLAFKEVRAATA